MVLAAATALPLTSVAAVPKSVQSPVLRIDKSRIDRALQSMVTDGRAAGASALVWRDGKEVYFGTAGFADSEAKRPFRRDTLVQIWSMTKPVTGVALMQLWEQGKFRLDDPLSDYLSEFGQTKVFAGTDAAGNPILRPPHRPILVRDIMRHTAGFGEGAPGSYPQKMFDAADPLNFDNDLTEFGRRLATVPLFYEPGTKWHYSAAVDVQALLVEKLSGQPFEEYVKQHIFAPLAMKDTAWTQPEERYARLAAVYVKGPDGKLQRKSEADIRRGNFAPRKLTRGGAGLVSSLDDYMRFARMLLNGGTIDGVRILSPAGVETLLAQTWRFDGSNGATEGGFYCSAGNGSHQIPNKVPGCADDMGTRGATFVGHAGDAYNMKSGLWIDRSRGRGIAYFVTGVADPAPKAADSAYSAAEVHAFRRTYALLRR